MKNFYLNVIRRNFSSFNKFKNISSNIVIPPEKIITRTDKEYSVNFGEEKTPPKEGQFHTLPVLPSKGMAMQLGFDEIYNRESVSAFYSVKLKDTIYHVFNAARVVRILYFKYI